MKLITKQHKLVTSIKVEFHRRALSSIAVPSSPCRGHWSTTHESSLSQDWKEKIEQPITSAPLLKHMVA